MKDPIAVPLAGDVLEAMLAAYDDPEWEALAPCAAGLISGANLVADHCCAQETSYGAGQACEGQLTVRVGNCYPTKVFPEPWTGAMPPCGTSWAVELEIAVMRCALTMDESTNPPSPPTMAAEMEVADRALGDMGLIRHTMTDFARGRDQALVLGQYVPMGPDGGCVGGAVTCTFLIE